MDILKRFYKTIQYVNSDKKNRRIQVMKNIIPILREKVIRWHRLQEKLNVLILTMDEMG